jgi:hypothetical protein
MRAEFRPLYLVEMQERPLRSHSPAGLHRPIYAATGGVVLCDEVFGVGGALFEFTPCDVAVFAKARLRKSIKAWRGASRPQNGSQTIWSFALGASSPAPQPI